MTNKKRKPHSQDYYSALAHKLSNIIAFILFIALIIFVPIPKQELRQPIEPYQTVEEEYIAAVEHYISTNEILLPYNSTFTYNDTSISISDNETDAILTCYPVFNDDMPIYTFSYHGYLWRSYVLICFLMTILCFIFRFFFIDIFMRCYYRFFQVNNQKALSELKHNAVYGDDRNWNGLEKKCEDCNYSNDCKCLSCMYLNKCGKCPSTDCEIDFEEYMFNNSSNLTENNNDNKETSSNDNLTGKCSKCANFSDCSCIDCQHSSTCYEQPSYSCVHESNK